MRSPLKTILAVICFLTTVDAGQSPNLITLFTYEGQPFVRVVLHQIKDDRLYLKSQGQMLEVMVDSIKSIQVKSESHAFRGVVLGAVAGGGMGYFISRHPQSHTVADVAADGFQVITVMGWVVAGGVIGGFIGSSHDRTIVFKSRETTAQRVKRIKLLLAR